MSPPTDTAIRSQRYDKTAPRRLREAAGLTIQETSKRSRVSLQTIRYLERGMTEPTAGTLAKLAQTYRCSVGDFFRVKRAAA